MPLFDLDSHDSCITADVEELVLDISQAVGEVHHAAIRKFDVKHFHVEVDVKLRYGKGYRGKKNQNVSLFIAQKKL